MIRCIELTFVLLVLVAGEDKETGSIKGKVTFEGKPVLKGKVSFHPAKGKAIEVEIVDGGYAVEAVPTGDVQLTVEADGIPSKYGKKDTSGLTCKVKAGKQALDLALTK